jgi:hypothetical protein
MNEATTEAADGERREHERELRELAASLNEAADDLRRNGPVSSDDLRRALGGVFSGLNDTERS